MGVRTLVVVFQSCDARLPVSGQGFQRAQLNQTDPTPGFDRRCGASAWWRAHGRISEVQTKREPPFYSSLRPQPPLPF